MSDSIKHPRGSERGNKYSPTGTEILTGVTRSMVPLDALTPDHLDLRDIAFGLANQTRFTGHNPLQPSIAQHSLAVCWIAGELYDRTDFGGRPHTARVFLQRAALMHDAAEAYVGDCSAAAKLMMRRLMAGTLMDCDVWGEPRDGDSPFDMLEDSVQAVINARFDCDPAGYEAIVHEADILSCAYELSRGAWCLDAVTPTWVGAAEPLARIYSKLSPNGYSAFLRRASELGIR